MLSNLFSKDSPLMGLANSYATGLANNASRPKSIVIQAPAPAMPAQSDNGNFPKYAMIGGGAFLLIFIALMFKGRK